MTLLSGASVILGQAHFTSVRKGFPKIILGLFQTAITYVRTLYVATAGGFLMLGIIAWRGRRVSPLFRSRSLMIGLGVSCLGAVVLAGWLLLLNGSENAVDTNPVFNRIASIFDSSVAGYGSIVSRDDRVQALEYGFE